MSPLLLGLSVLLLFARPVSLYRDACQSRERFLVECSNSQLTLALKVDAAATPEEEAAVQTGALASDPHLTEPAAVAALQSLAVEYSAVVLKERVGAGAHATVWLAYHGGARVALKMMRRRDLADAARVASLLSEAVLMHRLQHASVLRLVGVVRRAPVVALLLEYCEQGALRSVLDDAAIDLTWGGVLLRVAAEVAAALAFLHGRPLPVVHNDVKSHNVLLTSSFACKLSDFGSSRELRASAAPPQPVLGTNFYCAPELLRGEAVSPAADVYSLGMVRCVSQPASHPASQPSAAAWEVRVRARVSACIFFGRTGGSGVVYGER